MALKFNAVFEGGGVKGIGLVGAIFEIEKILLRMKAMNYSRTE